MFSTEFLLTSLVVVLVPGTGVIYTVSTGLCMGGRASIAAAVGCTAGIVPHLTASILGLAAIMHVSAVAFQVVKYAGVLYLLYLAWSMWRETGALKFDAPATQRGIFALHPSLELAITEHLVGRILENLRLERQPRSKRVEQAATAVHPRQEQRAEERQETASKSA